MTPKTSLNHKLSCSSWWWYSWFINSRKHSPSFFSHCTKIMLDRLYPAVSCSMSNRLYCKRPTLHVSSYLCDTKVEIACRLHQHLLRYSKLIRGTLFWILTNLSFCGRSVTPLPLSAKGIIWQLTKKLSIRGIIRVLESGRGGIILWTKTVPGVRHEDQGQECESKWTI